MRVAISCEDPLYARGLRDKRIGLTVKIRFTYCLELMPEPVRPCQIGFGS